MSENENLTLNSCKWPKKGHCQGLMGIPRLVLSRYIIVQSFSQFRETFFEKKRFEVGRSVFRLLAF